MKMDGSGLARQNPDGVERRSSQSALTGLPSLLTKAGRQRLLQERRMAEGAKLQLSTTNMTLRTGERLDSMRTGSAYADEVVDDAMAQTAVMRSGLGADYVRRTSQ